MEVEELLIYFILGSDVLIELNEALFLIVEYKEGRLSEDSVGVHKLIGTLSFSKKTLGDDDLLAFGGLPFEGEL